MGFGVIRPHWDVVPCIGKAKDNNVLKGSVGNPVVVLSAGRCARILEIDKGLHFEDVVERRATTEGDLVALENVCSLERGSTCREPAAELLGCQPS
jgi:hypothetical protein